MKKTFICSLLAVFMLTACATDPYTGESKVSKTAWGTGIGALAGAGIGALAGGEKGALIGAGVGARGRSRNGRLYGRSGAQVATGTAEYGRSGSGS